VQRLLGLDLSAVDFQAAPWLPASGLAAWHRRVTLATFMRNAEAEVG
jgi:hypothetical protein